MNGESYLTRRRGPIRPRESGIRFSIHEATKIDGFIVRPGAVIQPAIGDRPIALGSPSVEISYDRSKGRKVLLRAPVDPAAPSIHPDAHFLNYDSVFGIDTNTLSIGGDVVSVSCLYQCEFARTDEGVSVKLIPEIAVAVLL